MPNQIISQITAQSQDELQAILSQILDQHATPTGRLTATKIGRSAGHATAGIFRVSGQAQTQAGACRWSAVVKALGEPENPSPSGEYNAIREVDVYRSRAFDNLCGGVRSARCYAIQQRNDLQLLWLEDLSYAPQPPWHPPHFIATERHLGQFNAHWPAQTMPSWEWLGRRSFRAGFTANPVYQSMFADLPTKQDHPLMQVFAPSGELAALQQLWKECDRLLGRAEQTSTGICHMDCHPKNLFPMGNGDAGDYTVAIDWVKVDISNLGIDIGHLLASPMTWLEITPQEAMDLREPIFDAYMRGLADAGWSGYEDGVRLTYLTRLACEAIRNTALISNAIAKPEWRQLMEDFSRLPMTEICARFRAARESFFVACKEEALQLID